MDITIRFPDTVLSDFVHTISPNTTVDDIKLIAIEQLGGQPDLIDVTLAGDIISGILVQSGIQQGTELEIIKSMKAIALKRLGKIPTENDFFEEVGSDGPHIADYVHAGISPNAKVDASRTILFIFPSPKTTELLIKLGADPDYEVPIFRCKGDPYVPSPTTPIRIAAGHGEFNFIKTLLSLGVPTHSGNGSLLHIACGSPFGSGHEFVRRMLTDLKMNVNELDADNKTPLDWAVSPYNGSTTMAGKVMNVLKEFGARPTEITFNQVVDYEMLSILIKLFPDDTPNHIKQYSLSKQQQPYAQQPQPLVPLSVGWQASLPNQQQPLQFLQQAPVAQPVQFNPMLYQSQPPGVAPQQASSHSFVSQQQPPLQFLPQQATQQPQQQFNPAFHQPPVPQQAPPSQQWQQPPQQAGFRPQFQPPHDHGPQEDAVRPSIAENQNTKETNNEAAPVEQKTEEVVTEDSPVENKETPTPTEDKPAEESKEETPNPEETPSAEEKKESAKEVVTEEKTTEAPAAEEEKEETPAQAVEEDAEKEETPAKAVEEDAEKEEETPSEKVTDESEPTKKEEDTPATEEKAEEVPTTKEEKETPAADKSDETTEKDEQ